MKVYLKSFAISMLLLSFVACNTDSPLSTSHDKIPDIPKILIATAMNQQVFLTWNTAAEATTYFVYFSVGNSVSKFSNRIATNDTSVSLVGLRNGSLYAISVSSSNQYGESALSEVKLITPQLGISIPIQPTIDSILPGDGNLTICWSNVTGSDSYNLYALSIKANDTNYISFDSVKSPYLLDSLVNETVYTIAIAAVNMAGVSEIEKTYSGIPQSSYMGRRWVLSNVGITDTLLTSLSKCGVYLFAGTERNGMFRSSDSGNNWSKCNTGLLRTTISSLASKGSSIFVGIDSAGIFRSNNYGESWQIVNNGLLNLKISSLASSNQNVYAGSWGGGLYRSINNGDSWSKIYMPKISNGFISSNSIVVRDTNVFIGAWNSGLYLLKDDSDILTEINIGIAQYPTVTCLLGNSSYLFTKTYNGSYFVSSNNGSSWIPVNYFSGSNRLNALVEYGNITFIGTDIGIFYATNDISSWSAMNFGLPPNSNINSLMVSGNSLLAGTNRGLWKIKL